MTAEPELWIVDPSVNHPEQQAVETILDGWPGESRVFRPCLSPEDGPTSDTGYDFDGIVLLGSSSSVHDRLAWIDDLAGWMAPLLDGRVPRPLLGVCFGHQLIAHLCGGRVGFLESDHRKRLGVERSELHGCRLLPGRRSLRVVISHRETVETLPSGYRAVARRPGVPLDGLEHDELPIFSFQFHPEAGEEFARHVGLDPGLLDNRIREDSRDLLGAFRRTVLAFRG